MIVLRAALLNTPKSTTKAVIATTETTQREQSISYQVRDHVKSFQVSTVMQLNKISSAFFTNTTCFIYVFCKFVLKSALINMQSWCFKTALFYYFCSPFVQIANRWCKKCVQKCMQKETAECSKKVTIFTRLPCAQ